MKEQVDRIYVPSSEGPIDSPKNFSPSADFNKASVLHEIRSKATDRPKLTSHIFPLRNYKYNTCFDLVDIQG